MKVTERQQQGNAKKGKGFAGGGHRPALSLSCLTDFPLVLLFASVLIAGAVTAVYSGYTDSPARQAITKIFALCPRTVSYNIVLQVGCGPRIQDTGDSA